MAVDVCSEISSPRISFSHDLKRADFVPIECRPDVFPLEEPTIDFDFCIDKSFTSKLPSAGELFSNGKILPVQIKNLILPMEQTHHQPQKISVPSQPSSTATDNPTQDTKKRLKEFLSTSFDPEEEEETSSKSAFWYFRRSSSLNFDKASRGRGLINSLRFLSRSNSTGSVQNPKESVPRKVYQKQHSQKQKPATGAKSSVSSPNVIHPFESSKRGSVKGNHKAAYGNGIRKSSVLNIAPTYISKGTASLFGFGSLFCTGKSKRKNK